MGLYAINPSKQRCKLVAIGADYKNAMEDLLKLQYHLTKDRVEPALEMSKRGGLRLAKTLHVRRINDFEANPLCALFAMMT